MTLPDKVIIPVKLKLGGVIINLGGITLTIGGVSVDPEPNPDPFTFDDKYAYVSVINYATSDVVTISGINIDVPVSVAGDISSEYRINGGAWTKEPSTVSNNSTLQVRHITSEEFNKSKETIVYISDLIVTFKSTTYDSGESPSVRNTFTINKRIPFI